MFKHHTISVIVNNFKKLQTFIVCTKSVLTPLRLRKLNDISLSSFHCQEAVTVSLPPKPMILMSRTLCPRMCTLILNHKGTLDTGNHVAQVLRHCLSESRFKT